MGASFNTFRLPPCDAAAVKAAYARKCAEDRMEYGSNPYSGHFNAKCGGVVVHPDKVFPSEAEAAEWVSMHYPDKRGPAGAVRFIPAAGAKPPRRLEDLQAQADALRKEMERLPAKLIERARTVRSRTRGCTACGSSVAVAWIGRHRDRFGHPHICCPVCGDAGFLTTKRDAEWRDRIAAKIKAVEAKIQAERQAWDAARLKAADPARCAWLVGGWCPS